MKRDGKIFWFVVVGALGIHLTGTQALAAEDANSWRATYDLIMMWVNFGIFTFVIVKYARTPLADFFKGKKEEVARTIDRVEEKKEKIKADIKAACALLDESKIRLEKSKERILQQGERRKQEIIEGARGESRIMLEEAKRRLDSQILQAQSAIRSELIDMAVSLAAAKLPGEITAADNQKFVDQFLTGIQPK